MADSTADELRDSCRAIVRSLEIAQRISSADDPTSDDERDEWFRDAEWLEQMGAEIDAERVMIGDEWDEIRDAAASLFTTTALEIRVMGERDPFGDEWDVKGLRVVMCTGGPHVEIDTADRVVRGWWGSDRVTVAISSDDASWLEENTSMNDGGF